MNGDDLDAQLRAYYEREAELGVRSELSTQRAEIHRRFANIALAEGVERLLDVGAGPGLDTARFRAAGFDAMGLDLALGNAAAMRGADVPAMTGSLYALPVRTGAYDAVWSMSTLVHVPSVRLADALSELFRVVRPGGLVAIGTWGGRADEFVSEFGRVELPRFFAHRPGGEWRARLASLGEEVAFQTWCPDRSNGWTYQYAAIRKRNVTP